ncbi:ImmA/IrrE family metallo-endopeptidase [Stieleria varia]|uniref:IrrE N-terminal-like domain-containing protein n=1 Tax=Stieleria varia TaxID=2528005 RepID=A0A5C6B025_9BACT|nr:ImmA/IrrE family metallo-endopeptidase [Stieleria varia]TWU04921.1 hypothetical protein Pla52n_29660 [Stieleria varia]
MITPEEARNFALEHFPKAPEDLISELGITLRESEMSGCDGWCLRRGDEAIIRINRNLGAGRKRFTLAHELGHLILGIPGIVGESYEEMLSSDLAEEREVNQLASELLMPKEIVTQVLPDLPVVCDGLRRLARKSKVSELAAAIRVCNLAEEIGLNNALVVLFDDDDSVRWQWSQTLTMPEDLACKLLKRARKASPEVFRVEREDGDVIVASIIENHSFGSATMFVQLLPNDIGHNVSHHERRKQLERDLFEGEVKLQQSMSGYFGALKSRVKQKGWSKAQAQADFWRRYEETLAGTTVDSDEGRAYVDLRIDEWF